MVERYHLLAELRAALRIAICAASSAGGTRATGGNDLAILHAHGSIERNKFVLSNSTISAKLGGEINFSVDIIVAGKSFA